MLQLHRFPELFQACKDINSQRFYRLFSNQFLPRDTTPVYRRFTDAVAGFTPIHIVTTNVDELLERNLPTITTVGRTDLERGVDLLVRRQSFICKLHGSITDLRSMVFTREDYDNLVSDVLFRVLLQRILSGASIVFIGYSLQDNYLLALLQRNCEISALLGDGPHFAVLSAEHSELPSSVKQIRYIPEPHKDHRTSITIVEEMRVLGGVNSAALSASVAMQQPVHPGIRSCHFIFDPLPPGRWSTSQSVMIKGKDGIEKQIIVGTGFTNAEFPINRSSAMHDLIVGLLCFDEIIAPIQALGRLHLLLGSERFWGLVRDNILKFLNWSHIEGVVFPAVESMASGILESFTFSDADYTKQRVGELIREQLKPLPGKEDLAERQFSELETRICWVSGLEEGNIPNLVRGLLLRPSVRELLGVSGGTPLNSITRWQVFPVLRLASVTKIGAACRVLSLGSAKLDFGMSQLAGPAFASASGNEWTDDTASYVVCGRFNADLGQLVLQDLSVLDAIRQFRDTQLGESLRKEILSRLAAQDGAEVSVAVNSALSGSIPLQVLQAARDQFVGLYISRAPEGKPTPALWNDKRSAEAAINQWRRVSRNILHESCQRFSIKPYDPCPCNSGEKLRFCCGEALRL